MLQENMKNIVITLYKTLVYFLLYLVFIFVFKRINYALVSLTRTFVITTSAFFFSIVMMMPVYGNFKIGFEKSKPVFLSTMITIFIGNVLSFMAMTIMGIRQFPVSQIVLPGALSLVVTYVIQGTIIWVAAHLGNNLYFKLYNPEKTIIIDNNKTLYKKMRRALI